VINIQSKRRKKSGRVIIQYIFILIVLISLTSCLITGVAWQMDLPLEEDTTEEDVGVANYRAVNPEAPPPPFTSPAPPSPEPEER
jgi:hypothetical protein